MSFSHRDQSLFDIPAATYIGQSIYTANIPHIVCLTVNGTDMTIGAPVTTGGVQTLDNKSLVADHTYFIDSVTATKRIRFDATGVTAGAPVIISSAGSGTIILPNPAGGTATILADASAQSVSGIWSFTNATASTSTITGAIVVSGGVGIAGNAHIGGRTTTVGLTSSGSGIYISDPTAGTPFVACLNTTMVAGNAYQCLRAGYATSEYNEACVNFYFDGVGSASNRADLGVYGHEDIIKITSATVDITPTTVSGSTTTGSLIARGGAGIVGNLYVGGDVHATSATASTSTITGALVVTGGAGIAGDVHIGARTTSLNMTCTTAPVNPTDVARLSDLSTVVSFPMGYWHDAFVLPEPTQDLLIITMGRLVFLITTSGFIATTTLSPGIAYYQLTLAAQYRPMVPIANTWIVTSVGGVADYSNIMVDTTGKIYMHYNVLASFPSSVAVQCLGWCVTYAVA